jgi:hypothetical protein
MSEFIKALTSPAWWISVVVVGILINLASAYVKHFLDKRLAKGSTWWRNRTEKQVAERRTLIETLKSSEHEQLLASLDDIRYRSRALYMMLFGVFMMALYQWIHPDVPFVTVQIVILFTASVHFFASFLLFWKAMTLKQTLNEARRKDSDE